MTTKQKIIKAYWACGLLFFSSLVVVRCGVDQDIGSSEVHTIAPAGASQGPAIYTPYKIDYSGNRALIKPADNLNKIAADLATLDRDAQRFTRYMTITHLYNAGISDKDLETARFGLFKLLNSLSFEGEIRLPTAIDAEKTVYRFDLRDYGWSRNAWEEVSRRDPYALFNGSRAEREVRQLTQTNRLPFVRADWFAVNGGQGSLYHFLIGIPRNKATLERDLGINVNNNIRRGDVLRAGFNGSGVSQQNRMVERHETRFGSYWISYDFAPIDGRARRNLFEFPLDPFNSNNGFDHDGGEIIFSLPNGLQGYMLADGNGNRILKGPTEIVADSSRPDHAVSNGLSCHRCHSQGMIPLRDMIRPHVEKNAFAFSRNDLEQVRRTYQGQTAIERAIAEDNARFKAAMDKIGYDVKKTDPVTVLAQMFEAEMPPQLVAAEVGMSVADYQTQLGRSRFLSRRLGLGTVPGGTLKRETFEDNFAFIAQQFRLGQARQVGRFTLTEESGTEEMSVEESAASGSEDDAAGAESQE